ncbi:hypothetical protein HBN76_15920 [Pseudomonas sp. WS 5013]|uniref:hypothetical protein n=1 Tax=Pseudomonas sp. WS 5013 TaxID=2717475 RepID=UPI0014732FF6|nr:hypothetical protein [Pseudomonas sp. WS 5013]NMY42810.1 hypothetical protein [Pseudomonas sp. WS 5013]
MRLQTLRKGGQTKVGGRCSGNDGRALSIPRITSRNTFTLVVIAVTIGVGIEKIEDAVTIKISTRLTTLPPRRRS